MEHKIDRLSELPESVIEHILSFITLKKILQLSILSKSWQNIWTLFPIPKINQNLVWPNLYKFSNNKQVREQEYQRKRDEFNYFVEKTLLSRYKQKISIKKIEVSTLTIDDESCCAFLNRWIGYAIESNVKVLDLWVWPNTYYHVSESVLAAKSITELSLVGCNFKPFYSDISLSSLKKLVLDEVYVEDKLVQTLIASCPVVEEITFARCDGLKNIQVLGLPKLMAIKLLHIPELDSFEMEAPNLITLLIKLRKPCEINLFPCRSLENLELHLATVTDNWLHDVLSKHPLIKSLTFNRCNMLKRIKISSDHMKNLTFICCYELIELDIVTPNLHGFNYHGNVISFSSITSTLLEFSFTFLAETSTDIEEIEYLSQLSHSKLMTWKACYAEVF
jgi:hypothetical protein